MNILSSSHYRTSIIKKNIIGSFGVKIISILTTLLLVPITINYISSELYGTWLTLTSIIGWISFFDIGFGNGLKNKLAIAISLGDFQKGKIYISTTYFFISLIFGVAGLIIYFIIPLINWTAFLNVSTILNDQLINVIRIVLIFFIFQMILKIISTVISANQHNALGSFIDSLGQVLSLLVIFTLTKTTFPSLNYLALAFSGPPVLMFFLASLWFYSKKYKKLSPQFSCVDSSYAKDILSLGGNFFIIQIAVLVLYQTTNIIISKVDGPEAVTVYNVAYKYLSVSLMFFNIVLSPIWAAFTDAYTQSDYIWMNTIYKKLTKLYYITMILLLFMLVISPLVYKIWLGNKVNVPFSVSMLIAIYMMLNVWNAFHSMIINGIGKIKLQLYISLIATIFNIPVAMILGRIFGIKGVIISMIFFSILPAVLLFFQTKKILLKQV